MKRKTSVLAFLAAATMLMSSCADGTPDSSKTDKANENKDSDNSSVSENINTMQNYGAEISVDEIKKAYSYEEGKNIMPLYNVSPTEKFEFTFAFDGGDANVDLYDYVSVHTDSACDSLSSVYYTASVKYENGKTMLTVAPMSPVLANDEQDKEYAHEQIDSWGNAPIYYLAVHYDTESASAEKLDTPVIIPFTVKHEVEAPSLKGNISEDGRFSLSWEPVENAEKYIVYNLIDDKLSTGTDNHAIDGSKIGYDCGINTSSEAQLYLLRDGETTECTFDGFSGPESHSLSVIQSDISGKYSNSGQNWGVKGEYYVTAVVNGKESGLSNGISTAELSLPFKIPDEADFSLQHYETPADFPTEVEVTNIDGTSSIRKISYTYSPVDWYEFHFEEYDYAIEGTNLYGHVSVENNTGDVPAAPETDEKAGNTSPSDNVDKTPSPEIETIITPDDSKPDEEKPIVDRQTENTENRVENGNAETVPNVPAEVTVVSDNAEEEWLALNMINGKEEISLEAFPALQDPNYLVDVFYKVYYQNPYMMGINSFAYDYKTLTLKINYSIDAETSAKEQKEIAEKASKIVSENITNDMTDVEKINALYSYLENNSVYDHEALEASQETNFSKEGCTADPNAFNAYGIIVNGKGVCMSYAYSFKLLCDLSGVDCTVVTGYLNGSLPHAWNMVSIDGKMYEIDCTNNGVNTGIPYYLYQADSELAKTSGYTKDDNFEIDSTLSDFVGTDNSIEYYRQNGLCPETIDEYSAILAEKLTPDTKVFAVRWTGEISKDEFGKAVVIAYNKLGMEDKLETLRYSIGNGFIVIMNA